MAGAERFAWNLMWGNVTVFGVAIIATLILGAPEPALAASPGAEVFTQNCATCHTLAAAGAKGTVGPNLDQLKPSESTVEKQVINGGGAMPAFGTTKILTPKEIKEVSKFVAAVAGGQEPAH